MIVEFSGSGFEMGDAVHTKRCKRGGRSCGMDYVFKQQLVKLHGLSTDITGMQMPCMLQVLFLLALLVALSSVCSSSPSPQSLGLPDNPTQLDLVS